MWTFSKILTDEVNQDKRRRVIVVEFTDGSRLHSHEFSFATATELSVIKKTVKEYLDNELNFTPAPVTDIAVDTPTEPTKTQAEIERELWDKKRSQLATMMELVRDGVYTGTETPIKNLQAEVKAGFKAAYLN